MSEYLEALQTYIHHEYTRTRRLTLFFPFSYPFLPLFFHKNRVTSTARITAPRSRTCFWWPTGTWSRPRAPRSTCRGFSGFGFGKRKAKSKLCKTKKDRRREGKPACKGERVRTMAWLGR